jgi:hypothetical protein
MKRSGLVVGVISEGKFPDETFAEYLASALFLTIEEGTGRSIANILTGGSLLSVPAEKVVLVRVDHHWQRCLECKQSIAEFPEVTPRDGPVQRGDSDAVGIRLLEKVDGSQL